MKLPAALAEEARDVGLLDPESLAKLLRDELHRRRAARFFNIADRLVASDAEPLTPEQIDAEIAAVRQARRAHDANRR